MSNFSDIDNIRELLQSQGSIRPEFLSSNMINHGTGGLLEASSSPQENTNSHHNDTNQAVRDFRMAEDRDNIYDILDPHKMRQQCFEESKQNRSSSGAEGARGKHKFNSGLAI